jgi:hypothetical protein
MSSTHQDSQSGYFLECCFYGWISDELTLNDISSLQDAQATWACDDVFACWDRYKWTTHYQKYCYRIHPIRSGSSWTTSKILSPVVHIILPILIIGGRLSATVHHEEPLLIIESIISSGSNLRFTVDNGVYNQQRFVMWITSD